MRTGPNICILLAFSFHSFMGTLDVMLLRRSIPLVIGRGRPGTGLLKDQETELSFLSNLCTF